MTLMWWIWSISWNKVRLGIRVQLSSVSPRDISDEISIYSEAAGVAGGGVLRIDIQQVLTSDTEDGLRLAAVRQGQVTLSLSPCATEHCEASTSRRSTQVNSSLSSVHWPGWCSCSEAQQCEAWHSYRDRDCYNINIDISYDSYRAKQMSSVYLNTKKEFDGSLSLKIQNQCFNWGIFSLNIWTAPFSVEQVSCLSSAAATPLDLPPSPGKLHRRLGRAGHCWSVLFWHWIALLLLP